MFSNFKFFVSNIALKTDEGRIVKKDSSIYLIDFSDSISTILKYPNDSMSYDFEFGIGLDSLVNTTSRFEGVLDPINGMYWTWQSGFINFKLEGETPLFNTRKNRFIFHLGGYELPYCTYQTISFANLNLKEIIIEINLDDFVEKIYQDQIFSLMSPGESAVQFSSLFPDIFKIQKVEK